MAVPWSMTLWMSKMVWVALCGWVFSCLSVADEIASALRSGDMGPFHVIYYMLGEKLTEDAESSSVTVHED